VKNILADPQVEIRVKSQQFHGYAELITESSRIADYLAYRLKKHPRMVGAMLKADGISAEPNRTQLEEYAGQIVLVAIQPTERQLAT
jgi:hypothetical protein